MNKRHAKASYYVDILSKTGAEFKVNQHFKVFVYETNSRLAKVVAFKKIKDAAIYNFTDYRIVAV